MNPQSFIKWTLASIALTPGFALATIVQVQTSLGNFEINLFDEATPATVANFLGYVEAGDYENTLFHRSVPGFVVQGGGFQPTNNNATPVQTLPPVINEPKYSNLRGTVAMAKRGGDPNSATNQWFVNLDNNSSSLDTTNGGFTVFGKVVSGIDVVDAIAALPRFNIDGGVLSETPLRDFTQQNAAAGDDITADNWMLIENIVVLDASTDTAANLSPTLIPKKKKKSGALGLLGAFGLLGLLLVRARPQARR